jgi:hypothetical protein
LTKKENNKNELVQTHTPEKSTAGETSPASTSDQSRGRQDVGGGQTTWPHEKNQKEKIKHQLILFEHDLNTYVDTITTIVYTVLDENH